MITSDFGDKLLNVENKVDAIAETLFEFENHFSERNIIDGNRVSMDMRDGIETLRNEVKAMVALSERYMNSESKLQSISLLNKTIQKENKHFPHPPSKQQRNQEFNPY